jgi:excisionase family DNA binding protein
MKWRKEHSLNDYRFIERISRHVQRAYCYLPEDRQPSDWLSTSPIAQPRERLIASEPEILTVKEVCELLRVTQGTVYKLVKQGRIPAFKIGTDWRFRTDEIAHWLAEQSKGTPQ